MIIKYDNTGMDYKGHMIILGWTTRGMWLRFLLQSSFIFTFNLVQTTKHQHREKSLQKFISCSKMFMADSGNPSSTFMLFLSSP